MDDGLSLAEMRALAHRMHRNATKKISRNNAKRGADIRGTQYDPRRDLRKVKKYNRIQLKAYIRSLQNFNSRRTQFVPDASYKPIPASDWKRYKRAEAMLNAKRRAEFAKVKDVKMPSGLTYEQHVAMKQTIHPTMHDPVNTSTEHTISRTSRQVKSLDKLRKMIQDVINRARPGYKNKVRDQHKKSTEAMLESTGDFALAEEIRSLTRKQFDFLWSNGSGFANDLALKYHMMMNFYESGESEMRRHESKLIRDSDREIYKWVDWAKQNIR